MGPCVTVSQRDGGCTFERGLYRVLRLTDVPKVKMLVDAGFPFLARRILPFSTDWLGRVFAADAGRLDRWEPMVLMLEPGTGEALEIPCTIKSFHDRELIENRDAALAATPKSCQRSFTQLGAVVRGRPGAAVQSPNENGKCVLFARHPSSA